MLQKPVAIIILFYLLALLQDSFFRQFSLWGAAPNLVFVLFFVLVFFEKHNNNFHVAGYALAAGFFTDIFLFSYIGLSVIFYLISGFLIKKIQLSLRSMEDRFPLIYFVPLFILFWGAYYFFSELFLSPIKTFVIFDGKVIFNLVYNLVFGLVGFYIYKKVIQKNRQQRINL